MNTQTRLRDFPFFFLLGWFCGLNVSTFSWEFQLKTPNNFRHISAYKLKINNGIKMGYDARTLKTNDNFTFNVTYVKL